MVTEERLNTLLAHANPVADVSKIDLIEVGATTYLATLEQRSSGMTQLDTKRKVDREKRSVRPWLAAAVVTIVAGLAIVLLNQGDQTPVAGQPGSPDVVLADYQNARNSADWYDPNALDVVVAFYAADAVVRDHRIGGRGPYEGAEIIHMEKNVLHSQGSDGSIEFFDIVVSGSTVTFNHKFINRLGECYGGLGNQVTVENGKITLYDWGTEDPSQCG